MGKPIVVKEFEQYFVDNEIEKRKDLSLNMLSTNETNHGGSDTTGLVGQWRKVLKEGVWNEIAHYSYKVSKNIVTIKFEFEAKDNKDKCIKLMEI